jgi:[acyl-carrier-protein] S-malonyltransferase
MIDKPKIAFVFPGAAVEPCGAEAAFYEKHRETMAPFILKASEFAGVDLQECIAHGTLGVLNEKNSQLFTFAYSHGVACSHRQAGIEPAVAAGYSLGIYAAFSVSGAIGFDECLGIVALAFDIMKSQCAGGPFAMGAVIGLSQSDTDGLCASGKYPSVARTNTNNETCGVFSGTRDDLAQFFEGARALGALSIVEFKVSIPYHHPAYISEASRLFLRAIRPMAWRDAVVPIVSSIDQKLLTSANDLVEFLSKNLASPVHWQKVAETIAATGVTTAYECGPGISLCQNGRFIPNHLRYITVKKSIRRDTV